MDGPFSASSPSLLFFFCAALFQLLVMAAPKHVGDEQRDSSERDVDRGADGVPGRARRARIVHDEDDHEADREADQQSTGQVTEQKALRTRQEEHHRYRGEQRRVGRGDERENEDVAHEVGALGSPATLPGSVRRSGQWDLVILAVDNEAVDTDHAEREDPQ